VLNHVYLQEEIAETIEWRRDGDEQADQSPKETGKAPTFESLGRETAQLEPASEVNKSSQYQRQSWSEKDRPGTEDGVGNIWHGLSKNSEERGITLACIARKSLEICERCNLCDFWWVREATCNLELDLSKR
jgi:hypothetical protein